MPLLNYSLGFQSFITFHPPYLIFTGFLLLVTFILSYYSQFINLLTIKVHNTFKNICSHTPFLVITYIPVARAFLRSQELILRPLVIVPLPVPGHFCGTNCCLKFKTVRVYPFLGPSLRHICSSWLTICFNIFNSFTILIFFIFYCLIVLILLQNIF